MRKIQKTISKIVAVSLIGATIITSVPMDVKAATWKKNNIGWWYQEDNGKYPANSWKKINGHWYWFNSNGYMTTGWQEIKGHWYYMDKSGAMTTGWQKINGYWYYMNKDGVMTTGWQKVGSKWYYMYKDGVMITNTWVGTYYVDETGAWIPDKPLDNFGWRKIGNRWKYLLDDGNYIADQSIEMSGKTYVFDKNGWMLTGWQEIDSNWYYMKSDGAMAIDEWVCDGKYYVDENGCWVKNKEDELITNAALACLVLDREAKYHFHGTAEVTDVYLDEEGNYQFEYDCSYHPLAATAYVTFAPAYPHIYYKTLPQDYCIEVCLWREGYFPTYKTVKRLSLSKIMNKKDELKKEDEYIISRYSD